MEALLIINSVLVGVCMYFIKDFHSDFKQVAKKVTKLSEKVGRISERLSTGRHKEKREEELKERAE